MIPVASPTVTEIDSLPGKTVQFSVSQSNFPLIMRSMADLYSNRTLACVREYSTNARDAMIEAGRAAFPIEVTLPSPMNPYFIVKDTGVGMTQPDMAEVYTQFGDSTKRTDNDTNGLLGYGSKVGIAYTNTFTITSVKNGLKNVGVIHRTEDSMGGYHIELKFVLDDVPTNEPNGTEVKIPVHNSMEFERVARDFYRFWKPGTVLVNGNEPEWAVGEKIASNLYYNPTYGTSYVVMGNVPYRIANPDALFPAGMNKISFVAYVDNGTVEFTPSREDLKYSDHTKQALHGIIEGFVKNAKATAVKEISEAKTHAEAYKTWSRWRDVIGVQNVAGLEFKGERFMDHFVIQADRYDASGGRRYNTWSISRWEVSKMDNALIITGAPENIASAHKARAKQYRTVIGMPNLTYFLFTSDDKFSNPWVDPAKVVSWDALKKATPPSKKPKNPYSNHPNAGRLAGTFDLIYFDRFETEADVPSTKPLYYISVQEMKRYGGKNNIRVWLANFDMKAAVVIVPANRLNKFLRNYGHAKEIMVELKSKVVLDGESLVSAEGKKVLAIDASEFAKLRKMDGSKIKDPEIAEWAKRAKHSREEHLVEHHMHRSMASAMSLPFNPAKNVNSWASRNTKVLGNKYPLLPTYLDNANMEHIYIYMNAVYAARKSGQKV